MNKIAGIDITIANSQQLQTVLDILNRNLTNTQNNRQTAIDQFSLGTDQFSGQIDQIQGNITKVQEAINALIPQS